MPFGSMYLHSSSSLSSSADSSKTSTSESAPTKTGGAITREHEKLSNLDQQNSINKLAKLLNSSRPNRKPDYLVLRNSSNKLLLWKISAKFTDRTTATAKRN